MKLNQYQRAKLEPELRKALETAAPESEVRALVSIGPAQAKAPGVAPRGAVGFQTRTDMRRAMISTQERHLQEAQGGTLDQLAALGLEPKGGKIGRVVAVRGPGQALLKALDLPGVRRAELDQQMTLPGRQPRVGRGLAPGIVPKKAR